MISYKRWALRSEFHWMRILYNIFIFGICHKKYSRARWTYLFSKSTHLHSVAVSIFDKLIHNKVLFFWQHTTSMSHTIIIIIFPYGIRNEVFTLCVHVHGRFAAEYGLGFIDDEVICNSSMGKSFFFLKFEYFFPRAEKRVTFAIYPLCHCWWQSFSYKTKIFYSINLF